MDDQRAAVAARNLTAEASVHLTETVAMRLPFESLGDFKTLLKKFFSSEPWDEADSDSLASLVEPHLGANERWEHRLDDDLVLAHGTRRGRYSIEVVGDVEPLSRTVWDRVFSGPVRPEQTPHPRKVKFTVGGTPAPGRWYRRGESQIDDERVGALLEESDVTDVMVAGDFVTVGIDRSSSWEARLESLLERVTSLFWDPEGPHTQPSPRTREELLQEGGSLTIAARPEELHLLDPDLPTHRELLIEALDSEDARRRRAAVATLALSGENTVAAAAIVTGFADESRLVRRTAVDAAADLESEEYRPLFEQALDDADSWIRWKAVSALDDIGAEPSRETLILSIADPEFTVRFEAERVIRALDSN